MKRSLVMLLVLIMALLAVLGAFLVKVGMTTPQMFMKIGFFITAAMVAVLIGLLCYLLWLNQDKERNYFLFDRRLGKNIRVEDVTFRMVNEKMSAYITDHFENAEKLWMSNAWVRGDGFGANGEYRSLVAYKMLFDLADKDKVDDWDFFAETSGEVITRLCEAIANSGDRNLAQKLLYIRQNCGVEIAPLRSLLLGNKKYLAGRMLGLVRRNIEWYYEI